MANFRKMKTIGIMSAVIFLFLFIAAAHFLILPFVYNRVVNDETQTYIQLEDNLSDIDGSIKLKADKSLIDQKYLSMVSEVENLLSIRIELVNKLEGQIKSKWWKIFLPTKYKEYENKKVEAFGYLKISAFEFSELKNIEYSVQRLIISLDSYDKKVSYGEDDTDWENYNAEASVATGEGEAIAKQSSEYLKQRMLTKEFDDYIQQTVTIKNGFFMSFFDPGYINDKNYITTKLKESVEKLKQRPDLVSSMAQWREEIIEPISKAKDEKYATFLEKKSTVDQYYKDNGLGSDPLSILFRKTGIINVDKNSSTQDTKVEDIRADLNGDGEKETLRVFNTDPSDESLSYLSLVALDKDGKEMGRLPDSMVFPKPFTNSSQIYTPFPDQKLQVVSFDFFVGPHSSETIFFVYVDEGKEVLPICLKEGAQEREDCSFWSGEAQELIVIDLDNDGKLEVVETVDEYPEDGKISEEATQAIDNAFKDEGLGEALVDSAKRVAIREAGGRGKKVVWRIYKLNNNYFEKQLGSNYDKYFDLVSTYLKNKYSDSPILMKRNDMSKDSEDYNLFMRNFWTRRGQFK